MTVRCAAGVRWCLVGMLLAGMSAQGRGEETSPVVPLPHAHAHNDFLHPHPLTDALEHGFCSIEADIFLVEGELLIGHTRKALRPERTLERLYLEPLSQRVQDNGGRVYAGGPTIFLLIDIKNDGEATYAELAPLLAKYADMLSVTRNGRFEPKAVTVVISGDCPRKAIAAQAVRYAGIDGRQADQDRTESAHLMPWVSEYWPLLFRWNGRGPMPAEQRRRLRDYVATVHQHGRLVRFWATPENPDVWDELLDAGVDLIGTDELARLQQYLLAKRNKTKSFPRPQRGNACVPAGPSGKAEPKE